MTFLNHADETPIRPLELDPIDPVEPVNVEPVNPEPVSKIRPIEIDDPKPAREVRKHLMRDAKGEAIFAQDRGDLSGSNKQLLTVTEAVKQYGLDWLVDLKPVFAHVDGVPIEIPDKRAVVRRDTKTPLGVVSATYQPIQNAEAFGFLDNAILAGEMAIRGGGMWDYGARVFLQAELPSAEFAIAGQPFETSVLVSTSHDGSGSFVGVFTSVNVICRNIYAHALKSSSGKVRIRHTKSAQDKIRELHDLIAAGKHHFSVAREMYAQAARTRVSFEQVQTFAADLFPGRLVEKDGKTEVVVAPIVAKKREAFLEAYETAPGAMPGTAFGLMQASTYYIDHMRRIKAGTDALESSIFGSGASLRERAMQQVVRLIG